MRLSFHNVTFFSPKLLCLLFKVIFFSFFFLGLHPRHMEVARLGVKSELRLPAYTTGAAMWDPRCICEPKLQLTAMPDS